MKTPAEALTALIKDYRQSFLTNNDVESYYKINSGLCEEFAYEVHELFEHRHLVGVTYTEDILDEDDRLEWNRPGLALPEGLSRQEMEDVRLGGHCFLTMQGKWYDAECPEGVENVLDLPIFRRPIVLTLRRKGIPTEDVVTEDVIPAPACPAPNPKPAIHREIDPSPFR